MQLCWNIRWGRAATDHPSPAEPLLWPGPSPELPIQCPVLTPLWASKQVQSERWGCGPPGQPGISLLPSAEGEGGAPTCYESFLESLDEWCPELAGVSQESPRGRMCLPTSPPQAGLLGPSRGAALAVGPSPPGRWLEKACQHSAWPPAARPSFTAPKGGLPAVWDPLAGAESQVRRRHGYLGGCSYPDMGPLPRGQMCVMGGGPQCQPPQRHTYTHTMEDSISRDTSPPYCWRLSACTRAGRCGIGPGTP